MGEGIVNEHKLLIVDPDQFREREYWLKFLPAVYKLKDPSQPNKPEEEKKQQQQNDQSLKVAWRYNNLLEQDGQNQTDILYKFDNSKEMGKAFSNSMSHQLLKEELTVHMKFSAETNNFIDLWEQICEQIQNNLSTESDDRIFRIMMPNFDQFLNSDNKKKSEKDLIRFLRNLKTMIRSTNGVCLISFDEDLISKFLLNNIVFLADSVYKINSFKGKIQRDNSFLIDYQEMQIGEYDGTIKLVKQPKIHGFISQLSDFDIFALRLKGKSGILIEKIHLEPEEDRSAQDENLQQKGFRKPKQLGQVAAVQCNPTKSHQLDF